MRGPGGASRTGTYQRVDLGRRHALDGRHTRRGKTRCSRGPVGAAVIEPYAADSASLAARGPSAAQLSGIRHHLPFAPPPLMCRVAHGSKPAGLPAHTLINGHSGVLVTRSLGWSWTTGPSRPHPGCPARRSARMGGRGSLCTGRAGVPSGILRQSRTPGVGQRWGFPVPKVGTSRLWSRLERRYRRAGLTSDGRF